jgi:hypothetical protein
MILAFFAREPVVYGYVSCIRCASNLSVLKSIQSLEDLTILFSAGALPAWGGLF